MVYAPFYSVRNCVLLASNKLFVDVWVKIFSKSTASQTVRFQHEDSIMTIYKLCKLEGNLWTSMFPDLPNVELGLIRSVASSYHLIFVQWVLSVFEKLLVLRWHYNNGPNNWTQKKLSNRHSENCWLVNTNLICRNYNVS